MKLLNQSSNNPKAVISVPDDNVDLESQDLPEKKQTSALATIMTEDPTSGLSLAPMLKFGDRKAALLVSRQEESKTWLLFCDIFLLPRIFPDASQKVVVWKIRPKSCQYFWNVLWIVIGTVIFSFNTTTLIHWNSVSVMLKNHLDLGKSYVPALQMIFVTFACYGILTVIICTIQIYGLYKDKKNLKSLTPITGVLEFVVMTVTLALLGGHKPYTLILFFLWCLPIMSHGGLVLLKYCVYNKKKSGDLPERIKLIQDKVRQELWLYILDLMFLAAALVMSLLSRFSLGVAFSVVIGYCLLVVSLLFLAQLYLYLRTKTIAVKQLQLTTSSSDQYMYVLKEILLRVPVRVQEVLNNRSPETAQESLLNSRTQLIQEEDVSQC